VNEACREPDLPIESLGTGECTYFGAKDFERDITITLEVAREIYDRHPSGSELAFDAVAIGEAGAEGICETWGRLMAHAKRLARPGSDRKQLSPEQTTG